MERLTEYLGGIPHIKRTINGINSKANYLRDFDIEAVKKLAAYEDTGMEPEEVKEITSWSYGPFHKKMGDWLKAEREGRLVVLPCKVGDTVYGLKDTELFTQTVVPLRVQGISVTSDNRDIVLHFGGFPFVNAFGSSIGKRVFLSRAEAEKAMEVSEDA